MGKIESLIKSSKIIIEMDLFVDLKVASAIAAKTALKYMMDVEFTFNDKIYIVKKEDLFNVVKLKN